MSGRELLRWCLLTTCPGLASYPNWDRSKRWGAISPGDGRFAVEQISYASSSCTLSLHQQAKYGILVVLGRRITKTQSLAGAPSELLGFTQTIGIVTPLLILACVGLSSFELLLSFSCLVSCSLQRLHLSLGPHTKLFVQNTKRS